MKKNQIITALIVDDVAEMRSLLKTTLLKVGVRNVAEADSAHTALARYRESRSNIVFLDINMPGESGISLLEVLKAEDKFAYVVMVSGDSTVENVKTSIGLGARGFVVKPYTLAKIEEVVKRYQTKY